MAAPDVSAQADGSAADAVASLVAALWPQRFAAGVVRGEVPLGESGLGLDSVEIAELLLECELHFGVALTADLFEGAPLTLDRVVTYFASI